MEQTLILLKPDCIQRMLAGKVLDRFQSEGFVIRASKMVSLSKELLREHYAHLVTFDFYPPLEAFMLEAPVMALVLERENAVQHARTILGPTDSRKAEKGTIRGDFGTDNRRNIAHASDSPENARIEIERFFPEGIDGGL